MIGEEVISKRRVSLSETLEVLGERKKYSALSYEQQTSYDYCHKFSYLPNDTATELINKLVDLGLPKDIAINIVDVFPESETTLETLISKHTVNVKEVMVLLNECLEISNEYRQKNEEEKQQQILEEEKQQALKVEAEKKQEEVEETVEEKTKKAKKTVAKKEKKVKEPKKAKKKKTKTDASKKKK